MVASTALLYVFVAEGLMDECHLYPATAKDPTLSGPKWLAVILWIVALAGMLCVGRRVSARYTSTGDSIPFSSIRTVAFSAISAAMVCLAVINPFSLVLIVLLTARLAIAGRKGVAGAGDISLFDLGG